MAALNAPVLGATTKAKLDPGTFGAERNDSLVHEVVRAELAARRQGTHATKTRGMVAGGRSKPWRQKGTGRARAGTTRAPQWTGGGVVFGPQPAQLHRQGEPQGASKSPANRTFGTRCRRYFGGA